MKLTSNLLCGFTPRTVYSRCCESYHFSPSHINLLINLKQDDLGNLIESDSSRTINLIKVTPEKYDVWFISQSNWTIKSGKPSIIIAGNYSWISEKVSEALETSETPIPRLVFAKNPLKEGGYTFLGIFKPDSFTSESCIRHYTRVSDSYEAPEDASYGGSAERKEAA